MRLCVHARVCAWCGVRECEAVLFRWRTLTTAQLRDPPSQLGFIWGPTQEGPRGQAEAVAAGAGPLGPSVPSTRDEGGWPEAGLALGAGAGHAGGSGDTRTPWRVLCSSQVLPDALRPDELLNLSPLLFLPLPSKATSPQDCPEARKR